MRVAATAAHIALWVLSGVLYFLFVLPRWWELMGDTTHTLGTVLRIVTGVLIALAALPVLLTLLRTRKPEHGTPQLALRLRLWSMILYVLAGVLIVGAAVAEIWVSLDKGGPWLFGIYGAAAAIAVLALLAFVLARTAELPAKAPKPKKEKKKRDKAVEADESDEESADEPAAAEEVEETTAVDETASEDEQPAEVSAEAEPDAESAGGLRNKRPNGKTNHRLRRRNRGTVAVDESE
jgi:MFS family permease